MVDTTMNEQYWFTVLFSVLVVSDQSAVPDMSSSEKNLMVSSQLLFVYTTTDLIGCGQRYGAIIIYS